MGSYKKIVAGITGAAALVAAPFVHSAFGSAANSGDTTVSTSNTSSNDSSSASSNETPDAAHTNNDSNKTGQTSEPVSVHTETINGQTTVTVNGESIDMPDDGSLQKTVDTNGGTTHISINTDGNGTTTSTDTNTTGGGNTTIRSRTSSKVNVKTTVKETLSSND